MSLQNCHLTNDIPIQRFKIIAKPGSTLCENCGIAYVGHYIEAGAPPASAASRTTVTQARTIQPTAPAQSAPPAASGVQSTVHWPAAPAMLPTPKPPLIPGLPTPLPSSSSSLSSLYPLLQQSQAAVPWQASQPAMGSTNDQRVAKAILYRPQGPSPFGTARGSSHPRTSRRGYPVHNTTKPDKGKGRSVPIETFGEEVQLSILLLSTPVSWTYYLTFLHFKLLNLRFIMPPISPVI